MGVIGTYPLKGDWIEVSCEELPRGYGRVVLERVEGRGLGSARIGRDYVRYASALKDAHTLVLGRGGLLGQGARAVVGGRVDRGLVSRMFCERELGRWVHLPAGPYPPDVEPPMDDGRECS